MLVGAVLGWIVFEPVMGVIMRPACDLPDVVQLGDLSGQTADSCRLLVTNPLEAFSVRVRVALLVALVIAGPVLFWQLWRFVSPGLTARERSLTWPFILSSQVMFMLGVVFAWFIIPLGLNVLLGLGGDAFVVALSGREYLAFFLRTATAFGLVFELPVLLVFLSLLGLVSVRQLAAARPYAIVINFVVAAIVTPTTDPLTLFAMALPMVVFYEIAIGLARLIERSRRRRPAA